VGPVDEPIGEAMAAIVKKEWVMRTRALRCVRLTVVAAALSMLGGTLAMAADTPDPWITMKTKIALMTNEDVSTKDLNVDTVKGVVTLHGMVATDAEKVKAEEVAMKVGGVKAVKNLLQVVPSAKREIVERADAAIKESVESAFKANHRITDSEIKVASVNKGVVLLSGKTKSLEAHVESVQLAYAVRGVRRVSTEVEVDSPNP
jgi:hyperosmotically inducible protein